MNVDNQTSIKNAFQSIIGDVLLLSMKMNYIIGLFPENIPMGSVAISDQDIVIQWSFRQPKEYCVNLVYIKVDSKNQYAVIRTPEKKDQHVDIGLLGGDSCDSNMNIIFDAIRNILQLNAVKSAS